MITFEPAADAVQVIFLLEPGESGSTSVVGNFNGWDPAADPFVEQSDGSLAAIVTAEPGQILEFRYLSETRGWFDDAECDEHPWGPHGARNNLIVLP